MIDPMADREEEESATPAVGRSRRCSRRIDVSYAETTDDTVPAIVYNVSRIFGSIDDCVACRR